ncbi:MAG: DUF2066 domain-containing protein [Vibrionaceae bacterium]
MMKKTFFTLLLSWPLSLQAFDLYQVSVNLADTKDALEQQAKTQAFQEVLVRVSGNKKIVDDPQVATILTKPSPYINDLSVAQELGGRVATFNFDEKKIQTLLSQLQANYWPLPRQEVLFWLINAEDQSLLWEQSTAEQVILLKKAGVKRGLPVVLPLGDMDDLTTISARDVWDNFNPIIGKASERYGITSWAVVKVFADKIEWSFYPEGLEQGAPLQNSAQGVDFSSFEKLIDEIADHYFATSAILLSNTVLEREYLLQISGITAAAEIFKLESSLKQMGSVASAQLRSIQKDEVSFTVKLASSQSQFTTELALNTDLLAVIDEEPEATFAVESEAEKTLPLTGDAQANLSLSQVEQELAAMTMPQVSAAQATASPSFDLLAPAPNTGAAAASAQGVPLTPVDGAVSSASAAAPAAAQNAPEAPPAPTVLRYMWRP